ncbi:MAG: nucleotidyl transferase AbiEii/AbiGii toxin family protein [Bdellovibrionales bacterium]
MPIFAPNLMILPPAQRELWLELGETPAGFALYGGTAIALRIAHRVSVDFDFFTIEPFDPRELVENLSYLRGAEVVQVAPNTLTCRVQRDGPVLVSFFGGLRLRQVAAHDIAQDTGLRVASLLDLAGTKVDIVQKRAEAKDYLDLDALLRNGIDLSMALAAAKIVYGAVFNPLVTLKALAYFGDVPEVSSDVQERLRRAVGSVDVNALPALAALRGHPEHGASR